MANPNPSPATRFGAGNRANPSGKTSAQRVTEYQNAAAATRIRERMLKAIVAALDEAPDNAAVLELLTPATLKLLKDVEDRAFGSPQQSIASPTAPGAPLIDLAKMSSSVLAELVKMRDAAQQQRNGEAPLS